MLRVGDSAPALSVHTQAGVRAPGPSLAKLQESGPVVLVLLRGFS